MDDLMGVFGESGSSQPATSSANGDASNDLMNGFAGLDMGSSQPPPPQTQLGQGQGQGGKKTNEDLLGLF